MIRRGGNGDAPSFSTHRPRLEASESDRTGSGDSLRPPAPTRSARTREAARADPVRPRSLIRTGGGPGPRPTADQRRGVGRVAAGRSGHRPRRARPIGSPAAVLTGLLIRATGPARSPIPDPSGRGRGRSAPPAVRSRASPSMSETWAPRGLGGFRHHRRCRKPAPPGVLRFPTSDRTSRRASGGAAPEATTSGPERAKIHASRA
jgi:hypothetical protein